MQSRFNEYNIILINTINYWNLIIYEPKNKLPTNVKFPVPLLRQNWALERWKRTKSLDCHTVVINKDYTNVTTCHKRYVTFIRRLLLSNVPESTKCGKICGTWLQYQNSLPGSLVRLNSRGVAERVAAPLSKSPRPPAPVARFATTLAKSLLICGNSL